MLEKLKNSAKVKTAAKIKKNILPINRIYKKTTFLDAPALLSKSSAKTLSHQIHSPIRQEKNKLCSTTRSMNAISECFALQSEQDDQILFPNSYNYEDIFSQSYLKIDKIKQTFPCQNIDHQLNQVMKMLNEQKIKVAEKLKALQKDNQFFKQICSGFSKTCKNQNGVNTEELTQQKQRISCRNQETSCDLLKGIGLMADKKQQTIGFEQSEAYIKLANMLNEMNINPNDILPHSEKQLAPISINQYKVISDREIIKVQKFFIKKLISKVPK